MALKPSLLFLLACFLLITSKVTSYTNTEEEKLALQHPVRRPPPPPVGSPSGGNCAPKCEERCKAYSTRTKPCVRLCTKCCEENKGCVPVGNETCSNWDSVMYHGESRKCP